MTGKLDATARATALRLIDDFGRGAFIVRKLEGTFNQATRQVDADTETETAITISPPAGFKLSDIDGTLVKQGDARVLIAAKGLTVTPDKTTDKIEIDSVRWDIVAIEEIWSGKLIAAYRIHLRK